MFGLNNFTTAGMFFLQIAGELVALFIGVTFLVGLIQEYVPQDKIQRFLTKAPMGVGNIIGAGFGALLLFAPAPRFPYWWDCLIRECLSGSAYLSY